MESDPDGDRRDHGATWTGCEMVAVRGFRPWDIGAPGRGVMYVP